MQELPKIEGHRPNPPQAQQSSPQAGENLAQVKNIIAVSSGKGGVGKSTVAVNLALSLAKKGLQVGLMDADVYGPSIPRMLDRLEAPEQKEGKLIPLEKYGIRFMSIGLLLNENSPVIWRGPMATKLIQSFLAQVVWGELDYLVIDLPPGTGDVQLTLTQGAPLTGAVVVTTPQTVAVDVTMRGIRMFDEVKVPILGVIENMSSFVCPHCREETEVFRKGGGESTARRLGLPFLGSIPLDPALALASDLGEPVVGQDEKNQPVSAQAFQGIVEGLLQELVKVKEQTEAVLETPAEIKVEGDAVVIVWKDHKESRIASTRLRYLCPCAECVDEDSGVRKIKESDVAADVSPVGFRPIGRYGMQVSFSDGHGTGIYTFNSLREM